MSKLIDVSDIRRVKFRDCEDPIIDIKVSEVEEIVYPIIVWRKGEEGNIYKSVHDREGKVEIGNNKLNLVNKEKRRMTGLEILSIIEKTGNCVHAISDITKYELMMAYIDPKVGWMFRFESKARTFQVSSDTINDFFFYFDENGDKASFRIYE